VGLAALLALAATLPVLAQDIQWKLQTLLNPGHMGADADIWFSKEVEKRTSGKMKVTVYTGGSLGFGGARIMQVVKDGLLETAEMWGAHTAGELRINEVIELPGLIPYDLPLRRKIVETLLPYWEREQGQRNIVPLAVAQVEPRNIYSRKPIKSLADLQGMKIRAQGVVETDFTKAIGATPVTLSWEEVYPAMQQGVIDGYWVTHSATFNAKLHEVARHCWNVGLGGATWSIIANRRTLEGLPDDIETIVRTTGREAAGRVWDRVEVDIQAFRKRLEQAGMEFRDASPEDQKVMLDRARVVWDQWQEKAGPVGKEMVARIQAMVKQHRAER
jgi:TRAP-type C4-dicarboxylate transport system substrate-binding protein